MKARRIWLALPFLAAAMGMPALAAAQEPPPPRLPDELVAEPADAAETAAEPEEPVEEPEIDPETLERILFEVPFEDESGGGTARGSAGSLEYERADYVVATGAVELLYRDLSFQAERVEVDLATKKVVATGQVILDEGPKRLSGERLEFDLESETGTMYEGQAFIDPDTYFSGREISKVGEDRYTLTDGMITSCIDEVPDWSFRLGKGKLKVDGYAQVTNVRLRAKKLPFFYTPYLAFPTARGRKSGLLMPNYGSSRDRGGMLGLAYYQTLGPSFDATLFGEIYEEDFLGLGAEFRYAPVVGTSGVLTGYAIEDSLTDSTRWKASLNHSSENLPGGMRGVVRAIEYSDFNFFRDFERDFNEISLRTVASAGFLTGNWGSQSFNFVVSSAETFIGQGQTVEQQQLPEVEYSLRPTQLGDLPLYVQVDSSAHYFSDKRTDIYDNQWGRADVAPSLTLPLSPAPWLSTSVTAGGRVTYYTDSLDSSRSAFVGESLTRTFPSANAEVVGPSFSKIFDKQLGRFGKFKHIIEPRWSYLFIGEFDDALAVPRFDEIDRFDNRNIFAVSLINRLLAKPADPESLEGAREILSFELTQAFSLNEDQPFLVSSDRTLESRSSSITGKLRFAPGSRTNLETRFSYNTLFDKIESASLSGGVDLGRAGIGVSWVTRINTELANTTTNQARFFTNFELIRNRLQLGSQVNYDFVGRLLQAQRHVLSYTSQCWGMTFEFRELRSIRRLDRDFRFAIALKNIGTFLDLNAGSREQF